MALRLRNLNNPRKTISISSSAWFSLLELAEEYGWNPMGTVSPEWCLDSSSVSNGGEQYAPLDRGGSSLREKDVRAVTLEDALNLADALEQAFLDYEPEPDPGFLDLPGFSRFRRYFPPLPGIGAIVAVCEFCRMGAFTIERHA
ncbi:MAG: hypothetical protein GX495_12190 [Chloroflexi bacterium]|nr:hypothetical protein [Chloroflexota bacterium]